MRGPFSKGLGWLVAGALALWLARPQPPLPLCDLSHYRAGLVLPRSARPV